MRFIVNLAKVSANGQVTVPAEVRRHLNLAPGDKMLFIEKSNGEVVVVNAADSFGYFAPRIGTSTSFRPCI